MFEIYFNVTYYYYSFFWLIASQCTVFQWSYHVLEFYLEFKWNSIYDTLMKLIYSSKNNIKCIRNLLCLSTNINLKDFFQQEKKKSKTCLVVIICTFLQQCHKLIISHNKWKTSNAPIHICLELKHFCTTSHQAQKCKYESIEWGQQVCK